MRKTVDFYLVDLILIETGFTIAYALRHSWAILNRDPRYELGMVVVAAAAAIWIILADAHKDILTRGYAKEMISVIRLLALICVTLMGYLFFIQKGEEFSRLVVLYFAVTGSVTLYAGRLLWKKVRYIYGRRYENIRRVFLMAPRSQAESIAEKLVSGGESMSVAAVMYTDEEAASDRNETAYEKMAAVRDEASDRDVDASEAAGATGSQPGSGSAGYEVVSSADAQEYIQREWIDEVVYAGDKSRPGESNAGNERAELLISECAVMGITVHRILDMRSDSFTAKTVERLGGTYVLTESIRSVSGYQLAEKKLMDIIGGVIGLVFTALLTLFLAPAIFISDPGPVFYSQERVGKNGRVFRIYKFRSMYKDAEKHRAELEEDNETDGMMFKMENDPRVLGSGPDGKRHGLGYFIRRHSLDEFPQFLNVLKGDMSLVGTRPPTVDEWNRYELRHRARLAIKPGLTGLWQTEGRSDIRDFDEVIALDMKYINEWTIAGDMKLILRTIAEIFSGRGAR